jgi:ribosomal protein S18 acetylase RimI-like enzyme
MANSIEYSAPDNALRADGFLDLVQRVWPGEYDAGRIQPALERTINVTAWDHGRLVGCVRLLTDGYLFATVPEILVDPTYQRQGVGRQLIEHAYTLSPAGIFLGAQPGNEGFFERLGFQRNLTGFCKRKDRR